MVDALKTELDKRNTRGAYKNTRLIGYFQGEIDLVINWVSILKGKGGEETTNDDYGECCFFESRPLHLLRGDLRGLSHDWAFPKVTLNGAITILHIGSQ